MLMMSATGVEVTLVLVLIGAIALALCSPSEESPSGNVCSLESLNDCLDELVASGKSLGKQVIPILTNDELSNVCRLWEDSQSCIRDVRNICATRNTTNARTMAEINQTIQEVNNGHEFICESDMRKTYSSDIRWCVEKNETALTELETACQAKYNDMSWYYNKQDPANIYSFCKAAKAYLACLTEGVGKICGESVAKWTSAYHRRLWIPHMNNINCNPEEGVEPGAVVIITLCAGATIFCVVFVIASLVQDSKRFKEFCSKYKICRKRKSGDGKGEYAMQLEETNKDVL